MCISQRPYTRYLPVRRRDSSRRAASQWSVELVAHSSEVYLFTVCVFSKTEHEPQGGEPSEHRAFVAHKPHCSNRNLLQLFALVLCAPLPTRRKLCFHRYNSRFGSLVFVVCEPCVRSTVRLRRFGGHCLAQKGRWHNEWTVPIYASADCLPRE